MHFINDPRTADPCMPWCCCCGEASDRKTLSPVHLRLTPRFPFLWLHRGRAPRSWWQSCLTALGTDPTDSDAGMHYLCPACLPLARAMPTSTPEPKGVQGVSSGASSGASASFRRDELTLTPPTHPLARASGAVTRTGMDGGVRQHVLKLRQVFRLETVVNGVTEEGHHGIELARGSAVVRCRACGNNVARLADLAGSDETCAELLYEFTLEGLQGCPNRDGTRSVTG